VQRTLGNMRALQHGRCGKDHAMEDQGLNMALSHYDQVASRAKDTPDAEALVSCVVKMCRSCNQCSIRVVEYFKERLEAWRALMQRNSEPGVRTETGHLVLAAMDRIKSTSPDVYGMSEDDLQSLEGDEDSSYIGSILHDVMGLIKYLLDSSHVQIRSWPEIFNFLLSVVRMGPVESAVFIRQRFLKILLLLICADTNLSGDIPIHFVKLGGTVARRLPTRPPPYEGIIALLEHVLSEMLTRPKDDVRLFGSDLEGQLGEVADDPATRDPLSRYEHKILALDWTRGPSNIFMEKLISIDQNPEDTLSILAHLIQHNREFELRLFRTLKANITGTMVAYPVAPFLRAGSAVLTRYASQPALIRKLIHHVSEQCANLSNAEGAAFFEFQRDVFDGPRERSNETADEILLCGLDALPDWAPGLLGYFNTGPSHDTEAFLEEKLFTYGPSPTFDDDDEISRARAMKMIETGRALGLRCLRYMRETYLKSRTGVAAYLVGALERVVKECAKYFDPQDADVDGQTQEFVRLNQGK
jgi:ubiquitin carboxyl-terminal hydrolase 34